MAFKDSMVTTPVRFYKPGERLTVKTSDGQMARGYVLDVVPCHEQPHWSLVRVRFDDSRHNQTLGSMPVSRPHLPAMVPGEWEDYPNEAVSPFRCRTFYAAALTGCLVK